MNTRPMATACAAVMLAGICSPPCLTQAQAPGLLDRADIPRMKVDRLLPRAMRENGIDCWLVFTREIARDPMAADVGGGSVVARAAFVFVLDKDDKLGRVAIVTASDAEALRRSRIYDRVVTYRDEGIFPSIKQVLDQAGPKRIAIDYSRDEPLADGLTSGMRDYLVAGLGEEYSGRFVSSEDLVVSFRSRKLPEEIEVYRKAVEMTQQIILSALSARAVTPGKTIEADIAGFMESRTRAVGAEVAFSSVAVGPSRAQAPLAGSVVQRGDLIRVDFGISWRGYKTDIQRTAYVLRDEEAAPPELIRKMWAAAIRANRAAVLAMKPGVTGLAVDTAARKEVVGAGYRDYPHATGHPVGFEVHDAGTILGPNWRERYGARTLRKLEAGQLYAVEPSVTAQNPAVKAEITVGLEEDVIVEADGAKYLGMPQVELILIR